MVEFDHFKSQAGLPTFALSPGLWKDKTNAVGFIVIQGKSGNVNNDAKLEILDLTGLFVYGEKMNASANFAESFVDVSDFKAGTYLIRITTGDSVYTKTLVKK